MLDIVKKKLPKRKLNLKLMKKLRILIMVLTTLDVMMVGVQTMAVLEMNKVPRILMMKVIYYC